jgi:hypothetical protein
MEKLQILDILSVCLYLWLTSMQSSRAALYCHLWPVRIYYIFTHYLLNGTIFEKKFEHMSLDFLYNFCPKHSFLRTIQRDNIVNLQGLNVEYPLLCHILIKLELSQKISENYSNNKFRENPSNGSRVVPCARTDGQANIQNQRS